MNVPNLITLTRLFSVPIIIWLIISNNVWLAFCLTVIAAFSDAIDGMIAKRFNCVTHLGKFLDPIADKVLLVSLFIVLGLQGYIATWLVIIVVFRDLLIVSGALMIHIITHSLKIEPFKISKINTVVQFVFVVGVLGVEGYGIDVNGIDVNGVRLTLHFIVALTTVLSGASYVYLWLRKGSEFEAHLVDDN
jgi:cardiolipin synthase